MNEIQISPSLHYKVKFATFVYFLFLFCRYIHRYIPNRLLPCCDNMKDLCFYSYHSNNHRKEETHKLILPQKCLSGNFIKSSLTPSPFLWVSTLTGFCFPLAVSLKDKQHFHLVLCITIPITIGMQQQWQKSGLAWLLEPIVKIIDQL